MPYLAGAAGSACLAAAGAAALAGQTVALRVTGLLGPGTTGPGRRPAVRPVPADRVRRRGAHLAGPGELGARPARPAAPWPGRGYALALGAVAVVLTATDAFTLLFAWESVTLAF